jgi:sugar transferase EpsL
MMDSQIQHRFLRFNWWIALLILLISVAIGLIVSIIQRPVYQSATIFGFDAEQEASSRQLPDPGYFCVFAESTEIAEAATQSLQRPDQIARQHIGHRSAFAVKCNPHPQSGQVELRVEAESPALANDLANAIIATTFDRISAQYTGLSLRIDSSTVGQQSLVAAAFPANVLIGLIGGLVVSGIMIVTQGVPEARKALRSSSAGPQRSASLEKTDRVLIVEHIRYLGDQLVRQVTAEGYQVRYCFDGPESLLVAEAWKPDLVLVEETLPEMNGFHIIEVLRRLDVTAHVPIILIADQGSPSARMRAYQAGADDWLPKPVDLAELSLRISAHIRQAKRFVDQQVVIPQIAGPHKKFPFTNKRFLSVLSKELRARGLLDQLKISLGQSSLDHITLPDYARLPYVGPDVMALPVLDDDAKIAAYKRLEWRKRLFDTVLAGAGLLVLSPLLILIALAVYLRMGRPIFFRQTRPGLNGAPFRIFKFRTMTNDRDENGELLSNEERVTLLGLFLRHTSLDELPELLNVLVGDMSLVGPRPLMMQYLELYSPEQNRRHHVWPGLTGWAQVNGRNVISWEEKFSLDVWYVDNRSLWLDIKVILMTIKSVLLRKGVDQEGIVGSDFFRGSSQETSKSAKPGHVEDIGRIVEPVHTQTEF